MQLDFSIKKMMFLTFFTNALDEGKMHLDFKFLKHAFICIIQALSMTAIDLQS